MREPTSFCKGQPLLLAPHHREELGRILQRFLPGKQVWAFGSRATGKFAGRFSDLDIAVENALPPRLRGELSEAFDESDLPIRVDIVELDAVDKAFAARIQPDLVSIQSGDESRSEQYGAQFAGWQAQVE